MKYIKTIIVITILLFTMGCVTTGVDYSAPVKTRYYDKANHYQGYSLDYGHTQRFYSRDGKYIGRGVK